MPRKPDSARLDLHEVFRRVQSRLLADLAVAHCFEHPTAHGTANETLWLNLFSHYLPARFRAAPAFVINPGGARSRQIDIAIYDAHHAPRLFPHAAGDHLPIESIYAVFEVKPTLSKQWLRDAAAKAASVRALQSAPRPILAGLLAEISVWRPAAFRTNLLRCLPALPPLHSLQYGCALAHGAFEYTSSLATAPASQALIFFLLRFLSRLNSLPPAPAPNLLAYLDPPAR
jgi:hypothetical protein